MVQLNQPLPRLVLFLMSDSRFLPLQDMSQMSWLTDFKTHGSGLPPAEAAAMSASVYFNRLQNWEKFKLATAI